MFLKGHQMTVYAVISITAVFFFKCIKPFQCFMSLQSSHRD